MPGLMFAGALIVAAVVWWAGREIAGELRAAREDAVRGRALRLMDIFSGGVVAAQSDPRALLTWQPLATTARQVAPAEFAILDRAAGRTFPFTAGQIQDAHAAWTAQWLAWEQAHDVEFKLKAAVAEHDLAASAGSQVMRAKLDAVEREKLESYQRRYEEYIRVAKALHALTTSL